MLGFGLNIASIPILKRPLPAAVLTVYGSSPYDSVDGDGWIASLTLPSKSLGSTFDPTKIVLTVSDPGYDATGAATTVVRTIRGGAVVRRPHPNQTTLKQEASTPGIIVYFSLQDDIYDGSTITGVQAEANYYGTTDAITIETISNSSTKAYPKPLFAWLNLQHERATGAGFSVEAVAYHRHGMNGRQVACVQFIAKDAQATPNVAATVTVSTPALSDFQTQGQRIEAYKGSISLTNLTQADVCQVNAKVYPWIGDSTAILDLDTDGIAWPTSQTQTKLRFLNDKNGTYGGAIAYVKAGAAAGTVSLTDATARADPYPTINGALAAIQTFNNASRGHNDHSGATIFLMDDGASGAVAHVIGANMGTTLSGSCWTEIKPDASAVGAVSLNVTAVRTVPSLLNWKVTITQGSGFYLNGAATNGNVMAAYEGKTITVAGTIQLNYQCGLTYLRNATLAGVSASGNCMHNTFGTTRTQTVLSLGTVVSAPTGGYVVHPRAIIGCTLPKGALTEPNLATIPNLDASDGGIIANNIVHSAATVSQLFHLQAVTRGFALVQNVIEHISNTTAALQVSADGSVLAVANFLDFHNTVVGERYNLAYTDVAGSAGISKRIHCRFSLWREYNCKSDTFTTNTTVSGRTGNWRNRYFVGNEGCLSLKAAADGTTAPTPTTGASWLGEYWEPSSTPNALIADVTFTSDLSGSAGVGGGTYSLTGVSNDAYSRVSSGLAMLAFDIAGTARFNDGTGAAGAYERP